jgi:hypothetical protein
VARVDPKLPPRTVNSKSPEISKTVPAEGKPVVSGSGTTTVVDSAQPTTGDASVAANIANGVPVSSWSTPITGARLPSDGRFPYRRFGRGDDTVTTRATLPNAKSTRTTSLTSIRAG